MEEEGARRETGRATEAEVSVGAGEAPRLASDPGAVASAEGGDPPLSGRMAHVATAARRIALLAIPLSLVSGAMTVCLLLVAGFGFLLFLKERRADADLVRPHIFLLSCYFALILVDLANGGPPASLLTTAVNYFYLACLAFLAAGLRRLRIPRASFEALILWTVVFAAAMSVFRVVVLHEPRPGGLPFNPIPFGLMMAIWGVYLLARALEERAVKRRQFAVALLALVPIALTESKIVMACALVGYAILCLDWVWRQRAWRALAMGALGVPFILGLFVFLSYGRLIEFGDELRAFVENGDISGISFGLRYQAAVSGFNAFLERPWLGYGLSEIVRVAMDHRLPGFGDFAHFKHLHNEYVTHLAAFGVFGGVFVVAFLGFIIFASRRSGDPARRRIGIVVAAMLALYMTVEIVFSQDPLVGPLFFLLALLYLPAESGMKWTKGSAGGGAEAGAWVFRRRGSLRRATASRTPR